MLSFNFNRCLSRCKNVIFCLWSRKINLARDIICVCGFGNCLPLLPTRRWTIIKTIRLRENRCDILHKCKNFWLGSDERFMNKIRYILLNTGIHSHSDHFVWPTKFDALSSSWKFLSEFFLKFPLPPPSVETTSSSPSIFQSNLSSVCYLHWYPVLVEYQDSSINDGRIIIVQAEEILFISW